MNTPSLEVLLFVVLHSHYQTIPRDMGFLLLATSFGYYMIILSIHLCILPSTVEKPNCSPLALRVCKRNSVALDLETKKGCYLWKYDKNGKAKIIIRRTKNFQPWMTSTLKWRFVRLRMRLKRILVKRKIDTAYYEQVYIRTEIQAAHICGGFFIIRLHYVMG